MSRSDMTELNTMTVASCDQVVRDIDGVEVLPAHLDTVTGRRPDHILDRVAIDDDIG